MEEAPEVVMQVDVLLLDRGSCQGLLRSPQEKKEIVQDVENEPNEEQSGLEAKDGRGQSIATMPRGPSSLVWEAQQDSRNLNPFPPLQEQREEVMDDMLPLVFPWCTVDTRQSQTNSTVEDSPSHGAKKKTKWDPTTVMGKTNVNEHFVLVNR
jgi:hypothetical protein